MLEIQEIASHCNGAFEFSFHAVRFRWMPHDEMANFLAVVFGEEGACAVICLDTIAEYGVANGANSWRGDDFESDLRKAISEWEEARGRHMLDGA